jgi:transcriptional regulator with XRE-family HTH domain
MHHFGARLRSLRKARGMTLPALAAAAGITKGYLSKIERFSGPPTFSTLQAIAIALQVELGELLETPVRKAASPNIEIHEAGEGEWQLVKGLGGYSFLPLVQVYRNKFLSPFCMQIAPGATAFFQHDGEEFLYQLSGEVELEYEHRTHLLKAGTSAYLDSRIRHRFINRLTKPVFTLAVNFVYRRF